MWFKIEEQTLKYPVVKGGTDESLERLNGLTASQLHFM